MESLLLLLDCIAIVLVVYWFARNESRKPGEPITGLLRYMEKPPPKAAKPKQPRKPGFR
jgi:hypothetical protein